MPWPMRFGPPPRIMILRRSVGLGLALLLVGRVQVGGGGGELRRAGVDALVDRQRRRARGACRAPPSRACRPACARRLSEKPLRLSARSRSALERAQARRARTCASSRDQILDLRQEPRIDVRQLVRSARASSRRGRRRRRTAAGRRPGRAARGAAVAALSSVSGSVSMRVEPVEPGLEPAQRLLQRLLEGAADRHHLADRLHLRRQAVVGRRELLEGEARDLRDHVVDRRLERGRRRPAGDVVPQLIERVADGELGGDLGDREAGRLGGQRRGARHARVHLDDQQAPVRRVDRELHVRAAGVDADLAQHRDRGVAHALVFLVGQRLRRRDGDRVAGVHAHRDRGSRSSRR